MGMLLDSLKPTFATPTLRGLRIASETHDPRIAVGELWPWLRVERCGNTTYRLLGERGEKAVRGAQRVTVCVRKEKLVDVARRAQARAFRLALPAQDTCVRFRFRNERCADWTLFVMGIGFMAGLLVPLVKLFFWGEDTGFPPDLPHRDDAVFLSRFVIAGYLVLFSIPLIVVIQALRRARTSYVRRAKLFSGGLRIVRSDGSRARCLWREVEWIIGRSLMFADGTRIEFRYGSRRVGAMLAAVTRRYCGYAKISDARQLALMSGSMLRAVALPCIVGGYVLHRVSWVFPEPSAWLHLWFIFVGISMFVVLAPWLVLLSQRIGHWIDKRQRRKQRADRATNLDR